MVRTQSTIDMPLLEKKEIQETLIFSNSDNLKTFREAFSPDEMGFVGREEGI